VKPNSFHLIGIRRNFSPDCVVLTGTLNLNSINQSDKIGSLCEVSQNKKEHRLYRFTKTE